MRPLVDSSTPGLVRARTGRKAILIQKKTDTGGPNRISIQIPRPPQAPAGPGEEALGLGELDVHGEVQQRLGAGRDCTGGNGGTACVPLLYPPQGGCY